jgi:integrase
VKASHDGWIDTARGILYRAGFAEEQTSKRRPPMIMPDRLLGHFRRWRKADEAEGLSHVITYALPPARHPGAIRRAERLGRVARVPQPVGDIHKAWASTVAAAGLERDVTPHTLKHTAITWMLHAGKTIWEVAEDTGTSAKTIEEVYGHHRTVESRLARGKRRA